MTQQGTRRLTKIELIRLRKRLTLASKIRRILKDRLSILVMEFLATARETVDAKQSMLDDFSAAYRSLSIKVLIGTLASVRRTAKAPKLSR